MLPNSPKVTERERERDRERERESKRERDRQTDTETETERERERVRDRIKRISEKKRETAGEIVWNRKNQEDKKEIAKHRYERQRE